MEFYSREEVSIKLFLDANFFLKKNIEKYYLDSRKGYTLQ